MTPQDSTLRTGKYVPLAELGRGGMADVYLSATHGPAGFSKLLVIKKLRASLADDPEFIEMLLEEARISARLNHPNVVQTYEVGADSGEYFIAMEYLDGQPLNRIVKRAQDQPAFDNLLQYAILSDTLAGLHHAHELCDYDGTPLSVVHRDVSPQNIFVTYDGQAKVVDFGIAKAARRTTAATRDGIVKGKMRYMAPEQALSQEVDRRADVFSVGVLLWQAATGRRFWDDLDEIGIVTRLIGRDIPSSPKAVNPDVPDAIDAICRRAMAAAAVDRYATAAEMQADIEAYLAKTGRRPTAREVGDGVANLFKTERAEVRNVIELKLAQLNSPVARLQLSVLPSVEASKTGASRGGVRQIPRLRNPEPSLEATNILSTAGPEPSTTIPVPSRLASEPTRTDISEGSLGATTRAKEIRAKQRTSLLVVASIVTALLAVVWTAKRTRDTEIDGTRPTVVSTLPTLRTPATSPSTPELDPVGAAKVTLTAESVPTVETPPPTTASSSKRREEPRGATARVNPIAIVPAPSATLTSVNVAAPKEIDDGLSTRK